MSLTSEEITAQNFKGFYDKIFPYLGSYDRGKLTFVGEVKAFFAETAPNGFLVCDGSIYNKADYPQLANLLLSLTDHSAYEVSGDNTKFKVPDLRGEFLRGTGTNSHTNQGSGAGVGVHQDGTEFNDVYMYTNESFAAISGNNAGAVHYPIKSDFEISNTSGGYNVKVSNNANGSGYTVHTSRPTNTSVLYCIAYKDTIVDLDFFNYGGARFSKSNMYDTNEKVIGKWINGKPLYQKTVEIEAESTTGMKTYTFAIPDVDKIWIDLSSSFQINPNTGYIQALTNVWDTNSTGGWELSHTITNVNLMWYRKMWQDDIAYITLRYTKTTDSIDSFKYSSSTDYSTEEKIVGTWIDGKPLYQKTVTGVSYTLSKNWVNLPNSPTNIKQVKNLLLYQDNGFCVYTPLGCQYYQGFIRVVMTESLSSMTGYTVQYTKTTD